MSEPIFVYAPETGEPFECSPANARDLVSHAGWSYSPLEGTAPAAPVEETAPVKQRGRKAAQTPAPVEETPAETPAEETETPAETPAEETETPAETPEAPEAE